MYPSFFHPFPVCHNGTRWRLWWVSCESPVPGSRESAGKASVRSRKSSGRTAKDGGNLLPIQETNNYTKYDIDVKITDITGQLNSWVNTLNIDKYSMYVENLGWSNLSYCDDVLKLVDSPVTSPRSRSAVKRCRRSTYLQGSFRWCFRKTDSDGGIRSFRKKKRVEWTKACN